MPTIDYEQFTVPELKEQAFNRGVEIPADARKADIIDALEAQDKEVGAQPDQQNTYEFQMSSTETATISPDEYWRIKQAV